MKVLYLLCGLGFAGKSTLARALLAAKPLAYIGLDEINHERGLRGGRGIPIPERERTSLIAHERFAALALSGTDVLVDDTNSLRWVRDRWRTRAHAAGYRMRIIFVDTPLRDIEQRRIRNDWEPTRTPIREEVFAEHVRRFERPTEDEDVLVYRPGLEVQAWIAAHLSRQSGPEAVPSYS